MPYDKPLVPRSVETFHLAIPAPRTETPFGPHLGRQAVLVRVGDDEGACGWGEIWCNFPAGGASHRAMLVREVLAPMLVGQHFGGPAEAFARLSSATHLLGVQCGEPGPLAQAIAGLDIALWDLAARREGKPLWRLLGGAGDGTVPAYASGMAAEHGPALIAAARSAGHEAFKLRIWGGVQDALELLQRARAEAADAPLMIDANQSWNADDAARLLPALEPLRLGWVEEPIAADAPDADWTRLAQATAAPLAGGENLRGDADVRSRARLGRARCGATGYVQMGRVHRLSRAGAAYPCGGSALLSALPGRRFGIAGLRTSARCRRR